jgi:gamma-tubulin complex component 2
LFQKIAGTIASVRKQREQPDDIQKDDVPSKSSKNRRAPHAEPSFVDEASFIRAPLNSRVEGKSAARHKTSKGKAKQDPLDTLPLDMQEAIILEELLFVLMVGKFHLIFAKLEHMTGDTRDLYHV